MIVRKAAHFFLSSLLISANNDRHSHNSDCETKLHKRQFKEQKADVSYTRYRKWKSIWDLDKYDTES